MSFNDLNALGQSNQNMIVEPYRGFGKGAADDNVSGTQLYDVTDTIITFFGDFSIPTVFDATLVLPAADSPRGTTTAPTWRRSQPLDFSGLLTDLYSLLHPGSFFLLS